MRSSNKVLVGLLALAASTANAYEKNFDVKYRQAIQTDDRMVYETHRQPCGFRVEIVDDNDGVMAEAFKDGHPFVTASKGERYSVRLYNPLPVRVAVNLTVDGINSITGKPSGIEDGEKWLIDPYGSVTIPGWQVSGGEARRFFFTDKPKSYAKWRGDQLSEDLAANCGVIGAAYFWSREELNQYYDTHPVYRMTRRPAPYMDIQAKAQKQMQMGGDLNMQSAPAPSADAAGAPSRERGLAESEEQAGTGMGESESHPTERVDFHYDTGMYSIAQAVVIYYGFEKRPVPNPFPNVSYAPEMP